MSTFDRTDTSLLGRWWWTVDRWTLAAMVAIAAVGAVVLLSPACASFDQFKDFEARGEAFRDLVDALPGTHEDPYEDGPGASGDRRRRGAEERTR